VSKITRTASAGMQIRHPPRRGFWLDFKAIRIDGDPAASRARYVPEKGEGERGLPFSGGTSPPPGGPLSRAGPAPCVLSAARSPRPVGRRSSGSSAPGSSRNRVAIDSLAATVASCSQLRDRLRHKMLWSCPMLRQRTRPKPLLYLDSECRRTAIMENGTFRERERESRCHGGEVAMQPFGVSASDHNPLGSPYSR
jgi:hypothetical protein